MEKSDKQTDVSHPENGINPLQTLKSPFLEQVDSTVDPSRLTNWINRLFQKNSEVTHPIRHILLMNFLGLSPTEFFMADRKEFRPFGQLPWPCLNKIAAHYRQPIIAKVEISRAKGAPVPVGRFACPDCGFTYTRRGPDDCAEDRYRFSSVLTFGQVWEAKFRELASAENLSLQEIARRLHVNINTVVRRLHKLRGGGCDTRSKTQGFDENRDLRRRDWINLVRNHPGLIKKDLRLLAPGNFVWLYRHDRAWLLENSPRPLPKKKYADRRVNWAEKDRILPDEVLRAAQEMLEHVGNPVRVTVPAIGKRIDCPEILLTKHIRNLPQTKKVLESVIESIEDFQVRRVSHVVKKLHKEGIPLTVWRIKQKACITRDISKRVATEIEKAIASQG